MLTIDDNKTGVIRLSGRLSAAEAAQAEKVFDRIEEACTVNFKELEYISSAGLGILLKTQKRLDKNGHGLTFVNMGPSIKNVFQLAEPCRISCCAADQLDLLLGEILGAIITRTWPLLPWSVAT